ncbi:flagellar assembly peptidoglycan hydrolase FlgJ [Alkalimarinus sediminis]|uniref:Peptidoglycan hydrolase FlgJ n=1 Tax=Alkalimarinus sediminis TaxID=1632866 RepID=A0A9E8HK92_9ALTE|nr:flagellar assembly peptidoglycan hydrolase FlgJ [Alkalimarinus sediminis]UZW75880.1 flagellar assembly peptidoglycan hydrolase FlgJ [Alkalimarinus sediminis]
MINSNLDKAHTYTDFSGLNALKTEALHDKEAALEAVSKQFESMFISMVMKSMREANKTFSEGNFLQSNETEFYQEMFDSQLSLTLSKGRGLGVAEAMMRQMSKQIDGITQTESVNPLLRKSIADYPRNLPVEQVTRKAAELADALVEIDATLNSAEAQGKATAAASQSSESSAQSGSQKSEALIAPLLFETPQQFIQHLYPIAQKIEAETGLSAKVMLAQSALETGWGKHMINKPNEQASYNLFGIKADRRWEGDQAEIITTEYRDGVAMKERASFRSYGGYEESFRDYANFLQQNPRYEPALEYLDNPQKFTEKLQDAGYATDPAYSQKIQRILSGEIFKGAMNSSDQSTDPHSTTQNNDLLASSAESLTTKAAL